MTFEQAKEKALKLNGAVNCCCEYEDAYAFGVRNSDGGTVVIMKQSGEALNMPGYIMTTKASSKCKRIPMNPKKK